MTGRRITLVVAGAALALAATAGATKPPGPTTGTGLVFFANPVQDLEDESLTDQKDARSAVPLGAYHQVQLTNLAGTGFLEGPYVRVRNDTGPSAYSTTGDYRFFRDQGQFEQVMAYYWITEAQKYLQRLGFTGSRAILDEGIDVRINQWGLDNSFFTDKHHVLRFGKGDVDDAEDAEVILHEYGHAIQGDQVPGFGPNPDGGAIGEGFGDYFAVSFGNAHTGNSFQAACVADWDSTGYTEGPIHCLRRTDENLHYPEDLDEDREVHADGQLWSRALWDINQAIGNVRADTIIIGAQFNFAVDPSFQEAAIATVAEAKDVDAPAVPAVCQAFTDRGFITQDDCDDA